MHKIGIIGATGYTGSELVRLLHSHPDAEIAIITSESYAGRKFSEIHPQFKGIVDVTLKPADDIKSVQPDLVFLALPHGVSMDYAKDLAEEDIKVVDLSGDFRLPSRELYEQWYDKTHTYPEGIDRAVYGLPELFRDAIKGAQLVANPGCFPTGSIVAAAPLVKEKLVDSKHLIFDSKTGVTGAGVKPKLVTHFSNVNENFKAYGVKTHRHTIEIQETLSIVGKENTTAQFTPHLLPVDRGILTSAYGIPVKNITPGELKQVYEKYYGNEPFIRLQETDPEIKNIRGTNYIDIFPVLDERTGNIMVFSAIDNLVRGAAGQAVQNMNLMLGIEESRGLNTIPLRP
ncbi:MAG: N-acetyl-gamma-glutamyl-phosphate reductase [Bacteroidales bacterium]|nr:N-acetyl-gamma-glutamyl-phosphate reductase [Bacteroidales bacterium]MCF8339226.1 N-acetyl-gamma-glutamyl-phosphate reductase [Bacteroidales bacterium]